MGLPDTPVHPTTSRFLAVTLSTAVVLLYINNLPEQINGRDHVFTPLRRALSRVSTIVTTVDEKEAENIRAIEKERRV